MSGWASEPAASASRRRRSFASSRRSSGQSSARERSFSATTAFVRSSTARYTVAVAPRPSCCCRRKWWKSWPGRNVRPRERAVRRRRARGLRFLGHGDRKRLAEARVFVPGLLAGSAGKPRSHPPRLESSGMRGPIRSHPDPWIINGPWSHRNWDGPNFQKLMAETATCAAVRPGKSARRSRASIAASRSGPVHGQAPHGIRLFVLRRRCTTMERPVPVLRRVEHARRIRRGARPRFRPAGRSAQRRAAGADCAPRHRAGNPFDDGFRRIRPRLGGGLVPGSVTLIGGEPGIGKSTLLLQCAASLAKGEAVLYATGEESVRQVAERARRLAVDAGRLTLVAETAVERILEYVAEAGAKVLVIDSIQTMSDRRPRRRARRGDAAARIHGEPRALRQDDRHRRAADRPRHARRRRSPAPACSSTWWIPCSISRATPAAASA